MNQEQQPNVNESEERNERETQEIQKVGKKVRNILEYGGLNRNKIEQDIKKVLDEIEVPYTRIDVEHDGGRTDNRQVCLTHIHFPATWPTDIGRNGEYFIGFYVEERDYEPEEHP